MGQSGDARPDAQAPVEPGDFPLEPPGQFRPLRSGADDAHLPPQDVDCLGHLVQPGGSQQPAHPGYPRVVHPGPHRADFTLRFNHHRAEFDDAKHSPVLAQPLLPVVHRSPVRQPDEQRDERPQQRPHRQEQQIHQRQRRQVVGPLVPGHERVYRPLRSTPVGEEALPEIPSAAAVRSR